jgi:hypothetical protein
MGVPVSVRGLILCFDLYPSIRPAADTVHAIVKADSHTIANGAVTSDQKTALGPNDALMLMVW